MTTTELRETYLPAHEADSDSARRPEVRRLVGGTRLADLLALVGAAAGAVALTALLVTQVFPVASGIAFTVISLGLFVGLYALLVSLDERAVAVRDRVAMVLVHTLAFTVLLTIVFIVTFTFARGLPALVHPNFFVEDMSLAGPLDPLELGGVAHAIMGTLIQIAIALVITVPLGLTAAVFLSEIPGPFARFVRTIVEAMTALPSIVAGLFVYATFILALGMEKSGLAAALSISIMMLPIMIRSADVVLRLVPGTLKEAAYALGSSQWRTVWQVVLPTSRSGLTTGVILATARGIGETSPVLLTSGFTASMNLDPTSGPHGLPAARRLPVREVPRAHDDRARLRHRGGPHVPRRPALHPRPLHRRPHPQGALMSRTRPAARLAVATLALVLLAALGAPPASADSFVPVNGAGSSWSSNAVDQWRRNVEQYGMRVNYASTGSSDGRNQFKSGTVDFAITEIPYGLKDSGVVDTLPTRGFAYMPIVAGGTAFMYNLSVGGQRVTDLKLTGEVVTKIFTGVITSWDDPAIAKENPGLALPKRAIVPVVRSDGSGSTAQFATWMAAKHAGLWDAYCKAAGRSTPCGVTSNYPVIAGKGFVAQPNSQGVAGYVAQTANIGTITYVEYSYALKTGYPVAKVLNESGYFVGPTASNVAVGLLGAKINTNKSSDQYLTQDLTGVFGNKDKRAYPLSSYSYIVIPTETKGGFTQDKGKTLGAFSYYFLCEGQQQAEVLGYSPLPINLVEAGLEQVRKIPGVVAQDIKIKDCNNPTFSASGKNLLAEKAPYPSECDKRGATSSCAGGGGGDDGGKDDKGGDGGKDDEDDDGGESGDGDSGGKDDDDGTGDGGQDGDDDAADDGSTDSPGDTPDEAGAPGDTGSGSSSGGWSGSPVTGGGPVVCEDDTGVCVNVVALPQEAPVRTGGDGRELLVLAAVVALLAGVVVPPLVSRALARKRAAR